MSSSSEPPFSSPPVPSPFHEISLPSSKDFQGDTITFKMTISPSASQVTAVPTGPTSLLSRSYTVVMNVGA